MDGSARKGDPVTPAAKWNVCATCGHYEDEHRTVNGSCYCVILEIGGVERRCDCKTFVLKSAGARGKR